MIEIHRITVMSCKFIHTVNINLYSYYNRKLLYTSFNVKGQPIVNTPKQASDTFLKTKIDVFNAIFLQLNSIIS